MSSEILDIIKKGRSELRGGFDYKTKISLSILLRDRAKKDGEYYTEVQSIESLDRYIEKECQFYELVMSKLGDMVGNLDISKPIVVLWDIDDTLTQYGKNELRPGFFHVSYVVKKLIPNITLGICSARSYDRIMEQFGSSNSWFDQGYIFSARLDPWEISPNIKHVRGNDESNGHYQKVNTYLRIQQQYPSHQFILIDDIIGPQFEQQYKGFAIPRNLCYGGELTLDDVSKY